MTLAEIEETRRKIYDRADASLFIPSFNALRRIAAQYKLWWAQEELDDLDTRCTQMLRFNMGNVVDEGRAAFIADLKRSLVSLADRVIDSAMMLASGRFDYISMRSYNLPQPPSVAAVETTLSVAGPMPHCSPGRRRLSTRHSATYGCSPTPRPTTLPGGLPGSTTP